MEQQERSALKSSLGASNLTVDQRRIRELERELAIAKIERDIFKKSDGVLRKGVEVKYAMIEQLRKQYPVTHLCALLEVAKSGYQAWCSGKVMPPRQLEDMRLLVAIRAAHERRRGTYGPKKVRTELAEQGIIVGLNRIRRLRKQHGIRCTHKKKFRVTTDSKHNLSTPQPAG